MTPSLPNTPAGESPHVESTVTVPAASRKRPSCSKCKRPRLGHPRSGCPFVDDALISVTERLRITSPPINDDQKEKTLRRASMKPMLVSQPTMRSLSSTSSMIVNRLLLPGIMDELPDDDTNTNIIEWDGKCLLIEEKKSTDEGGAPASIPEEDSFESLDQTTADHTDQETALAQPRRLVRTMSAEQMDMFITALYKGGKQDPIAFLISKEDLPDAVRDAERRGLFVDANFDTGLLIVGRDRAAVNEMRKIAQGGGKRSFVKGVVVGSALTFTGLACS